MIGISDRPLSETAGVTGIPNREINLQAMSLLLHARDQLAERFVGLEGFGRLRTREGFPYMTRLAMLQDINTNINQLFAEGNENPYSVLDYLGTLDAAQQKGVMWSQEALTAAKTLTEAVELDDIKRGLHDRFNKRLPDGRYYNYLFPTDTNGNVHLVRYVTEAPLAWWQKKELIENKDMNVAIAEFNTVWGSRRLVEIDLANLGVRQDRTKIGWQAIDFSDATVTLVYKGKPYPNAPETMLRKNHWEGLRTQMIVVCS